MPRRYRTHHRRRIALIIVILLLVGFGIFMYTRPIPALYPVSKVQAVQPKTVPLAWPLAGESAIGALDYGVLDSNGAQILRPIASTAKLITVLTVLSKYPLSPGQQGPTITMSSNDVNIYNQYVAEDGSVAQVTAGEQISEYQMIEGMLLPSANNMADSLAIWAFGSLQAYNVAATQMLTSLSLNNTKIGSDASGFAPGTESTAHDLVLLGETAMQNPVIAQIVSQTQATLPVAGTVHNTNWLLGEDGIIGIKTGNSDQAGGVYIFAAQDSLDSSHSVTIVGTIQGTPDLQSALNAAIPLLDSAKSNFQLTKVAEARQTIAVYNVPWGSPVKAVAAQDVIAAGWAGAPPKPTLTLQTIHAPLPANAKVGSMNVDLSGGKTLSTSVVLPQKLPSPPWWWRITRHKL